MKRIGLVLFISVFLMTFCFALDIDVGTLCNNDSVVGMELPGGVPFSNEVFNIYLADEIVGSIVLKDKKIDSVSCDEDDDSTYNVYVESEDVVDDIMAADDKIDEYNKKRRDGSLRIDAVGFFRTIKLGFMNFFSRFF